MIATDWITGGCPNRCLMHSRNFHFFLPLNFVNKVKKKEKKYVLPYGQMSLWGWPIIAPNAYILIN